MGETTSKIEAEIEDARESLGSNLRELEEKIRSATDWKQQFEQHPMKLMGVAFGGGMLLGAMWGGGRKGERAAPVCCG